MAHPDPSPDPYADIDPSHTFPVGAPATDRSPPPLRPCDSTPRYLSDGSTVSFDKVLLAVGATPAKPTADFLDPDASPQVTTLASREDRARLLTMARRGAPVVVVGSSWAAVELASAAADEARRNSYSPQVVLVCPESGPLSRCLPRFLRQV